MDPHACHAPSSALPAVRTCLKAPPPTPPSVSPVLEATLCSRMKTTTTSPLVEPVPHSVTAVPRGASVSQMHAGPKSPDREPSSTQRKGLVTHVLDGAKLAASPTSATLDSALKDMP